MQPQIRCDFVRHASCLDSKKKSTVYQFSALSTHETKTAYSKDQGGRNTCISTCVVRATNVSHNLAVFCHGGTHSGSELHRAVIVLLPIQKRTSVKHLTECFNGRPKQTCDCLNACTEHLLVTAHFADEHVVVKCLRPFIAVDKDFARLLRCIGLMCYICKPLPVFLGWCTPWHRDTFVLRLV